jgi:hypothetical protein
MGSKQAEKEADVEVDPDPTVELLHPRNGCRNARVSVLVLARPVNANSYNIWRNDMPVMTSNIVQYLQEVHREMSLDAVVVLYA